ncbi:MAG: hypothetical protein J0I42_05750 [Bosea sp.]|uniref:hypothetical protein n=1 Tax=Bosea sp. (in: a-proteobacteria) TaxID=1871050 RepID=UPI001AD21918|nr:hypothetical protein [Bosea sp. (in: a-proteobacteria)]MBN9451437.1 hypothetical protein [Bosea sp. (in: a-proteobacteria)]
MSRISGYRTIALSALALVLSGSLALPAEPVRLITPEEARLPSVDPGAAQERNLTRGPGIDAVAPPPIGVSGTFRLAVRFKPRNSVAIDPESVRVTYRRQPEIDLTARLKPFVTAGGIEAPAVIVPPGKHVIVIEATDKEGRTGRSQMTLTVAEAK